MTNSKETRGFLPAFDYQQLFKKITKIVIINCFKNILYIKMKKIKLKLINIYAESTFLKCVCITTKFNRWLSSSLL